MKCQIPVCRDDVKFEFIYLEINSEGSSMFFLETPRLYLREIQRSDYGSLCLFLQDIDVMYAWEHAFSDEEVTAWIDENIMRYKRMEYAFTVLRLPELTAQIRPENTASIKVAEKLGRQMGTVRF